MRLDGKVALITGAGSGMGRVASLLFAREGAKIVATDVDDDAGRETEALAQAFRKAGTAVTVGESPWQLGAAQSDLVRELAAGIAAAVTETGHVSPEAITGWLEAKRGASVTIGHQDLWARPV